VLQFIFHLTPMFGVGRAVNFPLGAGHAFLQRGELALDRRDAIALPREARNQQVHPLLLHLQPAGRQLHPGAH
jgi:hypothetical protein